MPPTSSNKRSVVLATVDPARSRQMALVRGRNTKPELTVRQLVHSLGYRYRLHYTKLPGKPDLAFPARRKVIFVHGCFWHRHAAPKCWRARVPKTRHDFWIPKLNANVGRDAANIAAIRARGWTVMVIWECETTAQHREELRTKIIQFLGSSSQYVHETGKQCTTDM